MRKGAAGAASRCAGNSGEQALGKAFFNEAAHLGFKEAVRQIRIRAAWHEPMELSQATPDIASKICGSPFCVGLGWHVQIETRDRVLASFIFLRVKAPEIPLRLRLKAVIPLLVGTSLPTSRVAEIMYGANRMKALCLSILAAMAIATQVHAQEVLFEDNFKGKLGEGWSSVRASRSLAA